jgi:hypothetical protein
MKRIAWVSVALLANACSNSDPPTDQSQVASDQNQPIALAPVPPIEVKEFDRTLPVSNIDRIVTNLAKAEGPWRGELGRSSRDDSYSGGSSTTVQFKGGSAFFYFNSSGLLWKLGLANGVGERCGRQGHGDFQVKAITSVLGFNPPQPPDDAKLAAALDGEAIEEYKGSDYRINAAGSCVDLIAIKSTLEP